MVVKRKRPRKVRPSFSGRLEDLRTPEGEPIPPNTLAELRRDMERRQLIGGQIRQKKVENAANECLTSKVPYKCDELTSSNTSSRIWPAFWKCPKTELFAFEARCSTR